MKGDTLRAWVQASRPPFFVATAIPLAFGAILAWKQGAWHPGLFLLILTGSFMVHFATNIANDYFDDLQGTDAGESIGGSRVLQEGKITRTQLGGAIVALYAAASLIGLYFIWSLKLWALAPVILLAFFSSLFYTAPPVRYGYHGLGELFVAVNMGPVMALGSYWVLLGKTDWTPFPATIPVGLLVALILYYQSLPDIETDRATGKRTLAVRLGEKKALAGLVLFWIAIYLSIGAVTVAGYYSPLAFAVLLTVPILVRLFRLIREARRPVELDRFGKYIRVFYFVNGLILLAALAVK